MIDIGLNLTDKSFDGDRAQVVERARTAGVEGFVLTGTDLVQSEAASEFALGNPREFRSTAGVHPHRASSFGPEVETGLRSLFLAETTAAVGECGLDYNRDFSPRPDQRSTFARQLELAVEYRKPVFLHERDAGEDFFNILSEYREDLVDACLHCFTGGPAMLERCLELDLYVGVTGWVCDERRGEDLRAAVPAIPPDRLLIETDAPYLIPRTLRPRPKTRRNEPQWLPEVCRVTAELREVDATEIASQTTANARQLFRWPASRPS
ncbi:MAG: TatD family hydrolase [Planctomycetota bacterium]